MNLINSKSIIDIFDRLNRSGLEYILIRNIDTELPNSLRIGKDIDLLVSYNQRSRFIKFLTEERFKNIKHPHFNDNFLYGVNKFEFFINQDNVLFDLNYQLTCRSLNAGEWIPLDQKIQDSAWKNRKLHKNGEFTYYALSTEDELVTLITRSIFDKKKFQPGYINRIDELIQAIDFNNLFYKLQLIFFNFTPELFNFIKKRQYEIILEQYVSFSKY